MIKMVVFDMAGTTVDEDNVVYKTLTDALDKHGYDISLETVLKIGAGQEKRKAIADLLENKQGKVKEEQIVEVFKSFKSMLKSAYKFLDVRAQPGADSLFEELRERDIRIVLNTGYDRNTAEGMIEKIGWRIEDDIDLLVTASDVKGSRPAPDMILFAMDHFSMEDPTLVAKVGDSVIDIEEGKNAGCLFNIGVTTGAHTREQLLKAHPFAVIDQLGDCSSILL